MDERHEDRLLRFVAGEASPAERAEVERWMAVDPSHRAEVEELAATWSAVRDLGSENTWRPAWGKLSRRVGIANERRRSTGRMLHLQRVPARIAAALVVAASGVAAWNFIGHLRAQPFREFATPVGGRTTITLRDGTRLVLGAATRVRVPSDFGVTARTVELDGAALFTVVHDARRPFAVRTAHSIVRDVGTTFTVDAYAGDPKETIAVTDGEVALSGVSLRARDVASVDSLGHVTVRRGIDVSSYLAWTQGLLSFKDTPLRDVARRLAHAYGIECTVADSSLGAEPITATFTSSESVDEVLTTVTRTVGAYFIRTDHTIVIRRGVVPTAGAALRVAHTTPER